MAEISKPQDSKQPVTPAVAGNGAKDNARTIADAAPPPPPGRGLAPPVFRFAEAIQPGAALKGRRRGALRRRGAELGPTSQARVPGRPGSRPPRLDGAGGRGWWAIAPSTALLRPTRSSAVPLLFGERAPFVPDGAEVGARLELHLETLLAAEPGLAPAPGEPGCWDAEASAPSVAGELGTAPALFQAFDS